MLLLFWRRMGDGVPIEEWTGELPSTVSLSPDKDGDVGKPSVNSAIELYWIDPKLSDLPMTRMKFA